MGDDTACGNMNGIRIFREKAGLNQAELARRVGTSRIQIGRLERGAVKLSPEWAERLAKVLGCSPHELIYPRLADLDLDRFHSIFDLAEGKGPPVTPSLAIRSEVLASMLPGVKNARLSVLPVEDDDMVKHIRKGDLAIVDLAATSVTKPGLFAIRIGGAAQFRFVAPLTGGAVSITADNPDIPQETVDPKALDLVGRVRLRISTV